MKRAGLIVILLLLTIPVHAREVVHTERSLYRNIAVVDYGSVRCLNFTRKRGASRQSCIDLNDPHRLVLQYLPMIFVGLTVQPAPRRVLVIGLGGGTIVQLFSTLFPGIEIDAVEIDPAVVRVAQNYFDFEAAPGTQVHVRDGRVFVRRALRAGERYDFIVLDAFNGDYIPEHLMTLEFLQECRDLLSENGVVVANTFSSSRLYDSESVTYAAAFGSFLNLRRRLGNRVIIASRQPARPETIIDTAVTEKLRRFGVDIPRLLTLDRGVDWRRQARVLSDDYAPANLLQGAR